MLRKTDWRARHMFVQHIFPKLFELNASSEIFRCPAENCNEGFDSILLYNIIDAPSKVQNKSIIEFILSTLSEINKDKISDPSPDGCSAVRCLSCGHWYCNYCFMSFTTENSDQNKTEDHTHTATHHPSNVLVERSAFLPEVVIQCGHMEYKKSKLVNALYDALQSIPSKYRSKQDISIALILIANDIDEFDISAIWKESLARLDTPENVTVTTTISTSLLPSTNSDNNDIKETEISDQILEMTKQLT
eukprot:gene1974-3840_t